VADVSGLVEVVDGVGEVAGFVAGDDEESQGPVLAQLVVDLLPDRQGLMQGTEGVVIVSQATVGVAEGVEDPAFALSFAGV
jgi:hypothetical protein